VRCAGTDCAGTDAASLSRFIERESTHRER
jgi:hypothetical protein